MFAQEQEKGAGVGAHVMGGGEVEGAGGVLPRGHSGRRSPAAVSYNRASHSLWGRSAPHNAAATVGDFLIENWLTVV